MSQIPPAAHSVYAAAQTLAVTLPQPTSKVTIPIIVVFAFLAFLAIVRKLVALALIAAIIAAIFVAYQAGAFNTWIDKGKQEITTNLPRSA